MEETDPKKSRQRKKLLYSDILKIMEFYFSDSNLNKDRFLSRLIQEDPWIDLSVFLTFNKIRNLTDNIKDIAEAIKKSSLLQLSEDNKKLCRMIPISEKPNLDACTIYVERLPVDAEHDWLQNLFSKFGNVDYVSIPKYKHNRMIKGFAFIEFSTSSEAEEALKYFESIGCKLPTQMDPDQLASIATFENHTVQGKKNNVAEENKRQNAAKDNIKQDNIEKDNDKQKDVKQESVKHKNIKYDDSKRENIKKRKVSCDYEIPEKKLKEESAPEDEASQTVEEKPKKEKRKRKKGHKKNTDLLKQLSLQVLSKHEWKQLRNKYLNLQKLKMKQLKEHMNRANFSTPTADGTNSEQTTKASAPRFDMIPGCIVHFELPEPCAEAKKFKTDMKARSGAEYVDIAIGSDNGFLRFSNNTDAKKFCESSFTAVMYVLEGDEEKQYWDRIYEDRNAKQSKNGWKQRGREKLLKKAERELGKHIKFDDAE